MDIELLKEEIRSANEVINKKRDYIQQTQREIAEYLCPFEVGDRVISGDGEEAEIASISYKAYSPGYTFTVFKIKKDGSPYKNSSNVWWDIEKYTAITSKESDK